MMQSSLERACVMKLSMERACVMPSLLERSWAMEPLLMERACMMMQESLGRAHAMEIGSMVEREKGFEMSMMMLSAR